MPTITYDMLDMAETNIAYGACGTLKMLIILLILLSQKNK